MFLPYINMNLAQVYTCSPSWTPLLPPFPYHPSGSSQCTSLVFYVLLVWKNYTPIIVQHHIATYVCWVPMLTFFTSEQIILMNMLSEQNLSVCRGITAFQFYLKIFKKLLQSGTSAMWENPHLGWFHNRKFKNIWCLRESNEAINRKIQIRRTQYYVRNDLKEYINK